MKVLGLGGSSHDYSSCIVEDGKLLCYIEEERITREKHGIGMRSRSFNCIPYCMNASQLTLKDMDLIVANDLLSLLPFGNNLKNINFINHHLTHAAAAFYSSGFCESAIYVMDGLGSFITPTKNEVISYMYGVYSDITVFHKEFCTPQPIVTKSERLGGCVSGGNSLGWTYETITRLCGFHHHEEGKLMGLAAYGHKDCLDRFRQYIRISKNGMGVNIDIASLVNYCVCYLNSIHTVKDTFQARANVAYAMQTMLEKIIIRHIRNLYDITKCDNLCIGGGVALNSSLNGKISMETPFKNIFVHPASGDAGTAIGAALYGYYKWGNHKNFGQSILKKPYLGKSYSDTEIQQALHRFSNAVNFHKVTSKQLVKQAAEELKAGKILGWYQGGAETGPRALGHRSILANPTIPDIKDILNQRIKFRERFRPFAPSVLAEYARDYFNFHGQEHPYMLLVCDVKQHKREIIPGVTHVDGSARIQTVNLENNGIYYRLIQEFFHKTGIPLLLNTSFNIKGEPIVETPYDAILTFVKSNLDVLYLDKYIIYKSKSEGESHERNITTCSASHQSKLGSGIEDIR